MHLISFVKSKIRRYKGVMSLCIFGDSIVYGRGARAWEGWPMLLRAHLEAQNPQHRVYALGVPGQRTDGLLARFGAEAQAREPSIILFAIGINDSKHSSTIPPDVFEENVQALHQQARRFTQHVGFIGLTRVDEAALGPRPAGELRHTNASIAVYDATLAGFCAHQAIPHLNVSTALTLADLADGLHPNAAGHEKLFRKILPFVESFAT